MANVHGFNDLNDNRPNMRQPMMAAQSDQIMSEEIRNNRVPFMNTFTGSRPPLEETIPYTLKLVWCPTLSLLSFTTFLMISIWALYVASLTQGISTKNNAVLAPTIQTLIKFGAISKDKLKQGEVWRLITAAFLHADLLHITMNSISILFFLSRLQKCYNPLITITFSLASAISGNIASALINQPNIVSVGASTIIFGTFGGFIAYMTINWKTLGRLRSQLCCIVGFLTVISILMSFGGAVDLVGHLGGLIGGYVCGLAVFPGIQGKSKYFTIGGAVALASYLLTTLLILYL